MIDDTAYIYLDEAGNFDFSPKGSKYFIMTGVVMRRPFDHIGELADIKYDCLEEGLHPKKNKDAHKFHASEDAQEVRDRVFSVIEKHLESFSVYAVIIRKNKTNPSLRDQAELYQRVFKWLIGYIFGHEHIARCTQLIIVTDTIPVKKKLNGLRAALKKFMKAQCSASDITYKLYHHRSESDANLQIADYCCWAIQRKWERDDTRSYDIISPSVKSEGDLFKWGDTEYY